MIGRCRGLRESMAIPKAFVARAGFWLGVGRPTDHFAESRCPARRSSRPFPHGVGVLGDVGDPQLVGVVAGEIPPDQVAGTGEPQHHRAGLPWPGKNVRTGASHKQLDGAAANFKGRGLQVELRLGLSHPRSIGFGVHLADHLGQPGVPDRPLRRWPVPRGEVAGDGASFTRLARWIEQPLVGEVSDQGESFLWGATIFCPRQRG
jgi:hypothetical protein